MEKINLAKLSERFNPFKINVWVELHSPITREEIQLAIENSEFITPEQETPMYLIWDISTREQHVKRIAWLAVNFSQEFPIAIDFGIDGFHNSGDFILDGCHRIAAAIYRKEKFITAECCGSESRINNYVYHE